MNIEAARVSEYISVSSADVRIDDKPGAAPVQLIFI